MNDIGLRIVSIDLCQSFSKEYFNNCFLMIDEFRESIPIEVLNKHFHLGAAIILRFEKENIVELSTNGIIECEFDCIEWAPIDPSPYCLRLKQKMILSIGEYDFELSTFKSKQGRKT